MFYEKIQVLSLPKWESDVYGRGYFFILNLASFPNILFEMSPITWIFIYFEIVLISQKVPEIIVQTAASYIVYHLHTCVINQNQSNEINYKRWKYI